MFKADRISLDSIYLDPNNPRFGRKDSVPENRISEPNIQRECEEMLLKEEDLSDLRSSIKTNGFIPVNNLLVKEVKHQKGMYVVVEGNCRTVTMKKLVRQHETGEITLSDDIYSNISTVPVMITDEGDDKDYEIQGICHLIGTKPWKPFSQAKFLVNKMEKSPSMTPKEAGEIFGLSAGKASSLVKSYYAYRQLEEHPEYGGDRVKPKHFSYFEEALKKTAVYKDWLVWNNTEKKFTNEEELKTFYKWFLGDENGDKRLNMAIEVRKLPVILEDREVRNRFDDGELSLEAAVLEIQGSNEGLSAEAIIANLRKASRFIGQVTENAKEEFGSAIKSELSKIIEKAKTIKEQIQD